MEKKTRDRLTELVKALYRQTNIFYGTTSNSDVFPEDRERRLRYFVYLKYCSQLNRDDEVNGKSILREHGVGSDYSSREVEFVRRLYSESLADVSGEPNILALDLNEIETVEDFTREVHRKIWELVSFDIPENEINEFLQEIRNDRAAIEIVIDKIGITRPTRSRPTRVLTCLSVLSLDVGYVGSEDSVKVYKENLVLFGPPGTGKSRLAKRIAGNYIGVDLKNWKSEKGKFYDRVKILQFHPSISYEDFVEGIKPITDHFGELKYEILLGPCLLMIKKATGEYVDVPGFFESNKFYPAPGILRSYDLEIGDDLICSNEDLSVSAENPKSKENLRWGKAGLRSKKWGSDYNFVLLIDEINRAKVSQVFGELLFALADISDPEMHCAVSTQYSRAQLSWPPNLAIIGTLNNTDKSIDEIDQALRRRFSFQQLTTDYEAIEKHVTPKWQKWFGENPVNWLRILNENLSSIKENSDFQIGHSFFFKVANEQSKNSAINKLFSVLYHEILPTLESLTYRDPKLVVQVLGEGIFKKVYLTSAKTNFLPFVVLPNRFDDSGKQIANLPVAATERLKPFAEEIVDLIEGGKAALIDFAKLIGNPDEGSDEVEEAV